MSRVTRRVCFLLEPSVALALLLVCPAGAGSGREVHAAGGSAHDSRSPLSIRPAPQAPWDADVRDVQMVLDAAAGQLWRYFPEAKLPVILVEPRGGPVTLDRRGPGGELLIRLDTGGTYWSQYVFQFAHEFGHVLCGRRPPRGEHPWFEESICEVASLFVLRRLAEQWETDPPHARWKGYATSLRQYAERRMQQARLPAGVSLSEWYRRHADALRSTPYDRAKNRIVAGALLPLFEQAPTQWAAVVHLWPTGSEESTSFAQFLAAWRDRAPRRHRSFIGKMAERFGVAPAIHRDEHGADPAANPVPPSDHPGVR